MSSFLIMVRVYYVRKSRLTAQSVRGMLRLERVPIVRSKDIQNLSNLLHSHEIQSIYCLVLLMELFKYERLRRRVIARIIR